MTTLISAVSDIRPDPILSANIYMAGRLDEVIRTLVPQVRSLTAELGGGYLWFLRYHRCGEHLKLRIHAPIENANNIRLAVGETLRQYVGHTIARAAVNALTGSSQKPIDEEDDATRDYPDHSFIWTKYRRSVITFGSPQFVHDDECTRTFTKALAASGQIATDTILTTGASSFAMRAKILQTLIMQALQTTKIKDVHEYASYHRDWLIRFIHRLSKAAVSETELVTHLDKCYVLRGQHTQTQAAEPLLTDDRRSDAGVWCDAVSLWAVQRARVISECSPIGDGYTNDPLFPQLFKLLQNVANQLGFRLLEEALVLHGLCRASTKNVKERADYASA